MPVIMQYDREHRLTVIRHIGEISDREFVSSYDKLYKNTDFRNADKRLVDLRKTSSKNRSSKALKIVEKFSRELYKETGIPVKIAIVTKYTLSFGLARVYEALNNPLPIDFKILYDYKKALEWLNVKKA